MLGEKIEEAKEAAQLEKKGRANRKQKETRKQGTNTSRMLSEAK